MKTKILSLLILMLFGCNNEPSETVVAPEAISQPPPPPLEQPAPVKDYKQILMQLDTTEYQRIYREQLNK